MVLFDYKDKQFALLVISRDSWSVLRSYRLPDDMFVFTNMEGFKRKSGDIEISLFASKRMGLIKVSESELLIVPKPLSEFPPQFIYNLGTGFLHIQLSEEEPAVIVKSDPFGIQPIYFTSTSNATIVATRKEWIKTLSNAFFELPIGYELIASLFSFEKKRIYYESKTLLKESYMDSVITKLKSLLESSFDIYIYYTDNIFSRALIYLLGGLKTKKDINIVTNYEDLESLKRIIGENFGPRKVNVIKTDRANPTPSSMLDKCEISKNYHEDYKRFFSTLSELSDENKIILVSLLGLFGDSEEGTIFELADKYQEAFRTAFKCVWPSALVDPFLTRDILFLDLSEVKRKLKEDSIN